MGLFDASASRPLCGRHVVNGQGRLIDRAPSTFAFFASGMFSVTAVTTPSWSTAYGYSIR